MSDDKPDMPLAVKIWALIKNESQGRNEPFDDAEIRQLAEEISELVRDPQKPGTITGYRKHDAETIATVNQIKDVENSLGELITELRHGGELAVDDDLAKRAAETLQEGFMLLVRSIFQPESKLRP